MKQVWRWFGPPDLVSVDDMLQAGVEGVVTALHHIPNGAVWPAEEILARQNQIRLMKDGTPSGLEWDVVESLPVSEEIKKQRGDWRRHIACYKASLGNLSEAGIKTVCYNFMPVLDWTRTDLHWRLPNGATAMRFDHIDFALFDLFILERPGADKDYEREVRHEAQGRFSHLTEAQKTQLASNVTAGLPGASGGYSLTQLREHLAEYSGITSDTLRAHLKAFLEEVVPVAQHLGMRLCCHPDDPPFPLLGLPRVMSTEGDYNALLAAVDMDENGITLCSGSLGARADNDLAGMMRRLGHRVHFLHLRNVRRDTQDPGGSFYEAEHLDGDVDMIALVGEIIREEKRRKNAGRDDHQIPMRPDHGQDILDDLGRNSQPGYPKIGRLRGLAELRGVMRTFEHQGEGGGSHGTLFE